MANTLKLDHKNGLIVMDRVFAKKSENTMSNEYAHLQNVRRDYPTYTAVRKWFVAQFPEFRKNPLFYLYNEVKVVNIVPFIQEAQERAEELEAKKAEAEKKIG